MRGFIRPVTASSARAVCSYLLSTPGALILTSVLCLLGGCVPAQAPEPFVAKRTWLGVETRSTGSDYATLGYSQEAVITAQPVQSLPHDSWQVQHTEPIEISLPVEIEEMPSDQPPVRHGRRRAYRTGARHVAKHLPARPAAMCPDSKTRTPS